METAHKVDNYYCTFQGALTCYLLQLLHGFGMLYIIYLLLLGTYMKKKISPPAVVCPPRFICYTEKSPRTLKVANCIQAREIACSQVNIPLARI